MVVFSFSNNFRAISMFMRLLGLAASANQYTCLLFVKVLIQNSLLLNLFMSDTFSLVKFTEWMKLIFCQSSIISLM